MNSNDGNDNGSGSGSGSGNLPDGASLGQSSNRSPPRAHAHAHALFVAPCPHGGGEQPAGYTHLCNHTHYEHNPTARTAAVDESCHLWCMTCSHRDAAILTCFSLAFVIFFAFLFVFIIYHLATRGGSNAANGTA